MTQWAAAHRERCCLRAPHSEGGELLPAGSVRAGHWTGPLGGEGRRAAAVAQQQGCCLCKDIKLRCLTESGLAGKGFRPPAPQTQGSGVGDKGARFSHAARAVGAGVASTATSAQSTQPGAALLGQMAIIPPTPLGGGQDQLEVVTSILLFFSSLNPERPLNASLVAQVAIKTSPKRTREKFPGLGGN